MLHIFEITNGLFVIIRYIPFLELLLAIYQQSRQESSKNIRQRWIMIYFPKFANKTFLYNVNTYSINNTL